MNDKAYKRGECNAAVVEEGEDALLIMPMLQIAGFYVMNKMKNEFSFILVKPKKIDVIWRLANAC